MRWHFNLFSIIKSKFIVFGVLNVVNQDIWPGTVKIEDSDLIGTDEGLFKLKFTFT